MNKILGRIWFVKSRDIFRRALKRGVSYHHAGLGNRKRSCVEMLFRKKCLQVVAATGTLALGIHMPCKTVVFAGDSPFLNSLQYRQVGEESSLLFKFADKVVCELGFYFRRIEVFL
ncbi:probable ATP-dependent RNA helicase DDX60 [Orbicella faveolata]|uniref:probable ATP-dependent RNA helicase DDX60 n=1 Tax=Orbicella faveolata TaxID=48498 RepID=UPI0009E35B58|nr:probable ATP-dependent RNA helicase DDX60 [Orbicella faveolata]